MIIRAGDPLRLVYIQQQGRTGFTSSCASFNDIVLRAIRLIEFEPATRDGQPITLTKQLEYVWAQY